MELRYQQDVELLPDQSSFDPSPTTFDNSQGVPTWIWRWTSVPRRSEQVINFSARANPNPNAAKAQGIVTVTSREANDSREFDVTLVQPGPGPVGSGGGVGQLEARLRPAAQRPRVGEPVEFLLEVQSQGGSVPQVTVAIDISADARFTNAAEGPPGTNSSVVGRQLIFSPVGEISANSTLLYRFQVQASQLGPMVTFATISSPAINRPTQVRTETPIAP